MTGNATDRLAYRESVQTGLADMLIASFFIVPGVVVDKPQLTWLYIIPLILLGPAHKALKRRYVEPRLGYADLQAEPPGRLLAGIAIFAMVAIACLGLLLTLFGVVDDPLQWRRWSAALAGLLFAGGLYHAARRSGLRRYHLLAILSVSGGILISVAIRDGGYLGLRIYLMAMGIMIFINGVVLFNRFTRENPIQLGVVNENE